MPAESSQRRRVERLGPDDRRILRLESGPIAGHTGKILILGRSPDGGRPTLDQLRDTIEARLGAAPRMRQRLLPSPVGVTPKVWVDDDSFDIRRHVRQLGEGAELDDRLLRQEVGRLMCERLVRTAALWTIDMAALTGGRTALVWRIHHCMADGVTAMRLGSLLLWDPEPGVEHPPAEPWLPAPPAPALLRGAVAARERIGQTAAGLRRVARGIANPDAWRAARLEVARLPGTLRRELAPVALPSLLDRPAGSRRVVDWTTAPLEDLHRAGKAVGRRVTINDVVLAVVAGGFHEWLTAHGASGRGVRVKVPVSLHAGGKGADMANRDSFLFVGLPVEEPGARRRLELISRETAHRKRHHDAERLDWLLRGIAHLPGGGRAMKWTMSPRVFTFTVSNVRGPAEPVFVLGLPLIEFCSLAEIAPSHAVRVSVLSSAGSLCFGLCADADAVPDLAPFIAGIERSVGELLGG